MDERDLVASLLLQVGWAVALVHFQLRLTRTVMVPIELHTIETDLVASLLLQVGWAVALVHF